MIDLGGSATDNTTNTYTTLLVLFLVHGFFHGLGEGNFAKDSTANLGDVTSIAVRTTTAMNSRSIRHLTRIQKAQVTLQFHLLSKFQLFPNYRLRGKQGSKLKNRQPDRVEDFGVGSTISDCQLGLRQSRVQDGPDALDEQLDGYHEHRGLKHEFVRGNVIVLNVIR